MKNRRECYSRWLSVTAVVTLLCASSGCISSHARYTRPSRLGKNPNLVPRNWDYRKYYKIPTDRLKRVAESYLGVQYRWGGATRRGMDCSGFVNVVYREVSRANMPRTSRAMSKLGRAVTRSGARPGDLVFFRGGIFNRINHVGIYMGNGRFIHASTKRGVTYSSLSSNYYRKRLAGIRRIF